MLRRHFNDLTGQKESRPGNGVLGDFAFGTARSWVEVPKAAHVSLIYNSASYTSSQEMD